MPTASFGAYGCWRFGTLTLAALLAICYSYTKSSGASFATYNSIAASSQYYMSKATALFAITGYMHASGSTFNNDGTAIVPAGGAVAT